MTIPRGNDRVTRIDPQPDDRAAEAALIEQACRGCCDSFGTLVRAHQDRLYNFLLRRCGNVHMAEEVTQAAFVRAWENLSRFDPVWRFSTWLYTIALRLAADVERRERRMENIDSLSLHSCPRDSDPADAIGRREDAQNVWLLADRVLDADDRVALWMRYGDDASIEQIARVIGRSSGAVRVLLHRARRRLAEAWTEQERAMRTIENTAAPNTVCKEWSHEAGA